jgi:tetratricopeptide (TPR) repeat protein
MACSLGERPERAVLSPRLAWALLLTLVPPLTMVAAPALAESKADIPIGTRVILRGSETTLRVGDKIVARGDVHRVYRVEREDGPWLWLVSEGVRGWALASEVIAFDRALEFFTAELRKQPHSAWAYHMRGIIWYDLHDYQKAISDEDEAISLDPKDALAYHNRANAYYAKHDYIKAIADYNEATRLDPRDAASYENRALSWAAQDEHDLAIADLNEAIRLDPEGQSKYRRRALSWGAMRQYAHALADYDRALQLAPDDAAALNGRAWILATCPEDALRSGTRAVAEASRACTLTDWKDPYALGTLAAASAEAGDFAAAVQCQTRALELFRKDDPHRDEHRRRLEFYRSNKPWREAPAASAGP